MSATSSPTDTGVRRFNADHPCPICGGHDGLPRGAGTRCGGFLSSNGTFAHCTRAEHAGPLPQNENSHTYAHLMTGTCGCGIEHRGGNGRKIVAIYDYRDATRALLYQAVRYDPKGFSLRRPNGRGWVNNIQGVAPVLYRLPDVVAGSASTPVVVVEGEKDADRLASLGILATTSAMGARAPWQDSYSDTLRGRHVVIVADNDDDGHRHAQKVAHALWGVAASVKVLDLPNLPPKGDVSDWLDNRHSADDLHALMDAAPLWEPAGEENGHSAAPVLANAFGGQGLTRARWPELKPEALYGLAGDIVRAIAPHTEADPAALLTNALVCFGNVVGHTPHALAEGNRHTGNLYATLVGDTAKGRKGSSLGRIKALFDAVDSVWQREKILSGLSSGEGLVNAVRDESDKCDGDGVPLDAGVPDKRLLVIEEEFASTLKVMGREGSTLSAILRQAWDSGHLRVLNKNSPLAATGAHISLIGHVTRGELQRYLTETEAGNGFANRFLWICCRRGQVLPEGGGRPCYDHILPRLRAAVQFASQHTQPIVRDDNARAIWAAVYGPLSEGQPGLLGAVTSRAEAQVLRLSALYAMLDCSPLIRKEHLLAALAVWDYAEDSARYIFGAALGNPVADELLDVLRSRPEGLTRTEIRDLFGRHKKTAPALVTLAAAGLARCEQVQTGGRPEERWFAVTP